MEPTSPFRITHDNTRKWGYPPNVRVSSDFAGIAGRLDLSSLSPYQRSPIVHTIDEFPGKQGPRSIGWPAWCLQLIASRFGVNSLHATQRNITAAWAGSIWNAPWYTATSTAADSCYVQLCRMLRQEDFSSRFKRIEGDFVACIMTSDEVLLSSSLEATTSLFYRISGETLIWSTNYVDLVDPLSEINVSRLAAFAWGASVLPYDQVKRVSAGAYVRFGRYGEQHGILDEHSTPNLNRRMTLADWGGYARQTVLQAVEKRSKRFDKVGVVLSGGIDSSALVRCLVDIGSDVVCYNWASPRFAPSDESEYAAAVCRHLGVPLRTIDVGADRVPGGRLIDSSWSFRVPYNHALYGWWERTARMAGSEVDCLVSGLGGDAAFGSTNFRLWSVLKNVPFQDVFGVVRQGLSIPGVSLTRRITRPLMMNLFSQEHRPRSLPPLRSVDMYTEAATSAVLKYRASSDIWPQSVALDMNVFRPNGLVHLAPYTDRDVVALGRILPYGQLPYAGQFVSKPVLRRAFLGSLPSKVVGRSFNTAFGGIQQEYCINNREVLGTIINDRSYLVSANVIDHESFRDVLASDVKLRPNARSIIVNCIVSLWLDTLHGRDKCLD